MISHDFDKTGLPKLDKQLRRLSAELVTREVTNGFAYVTPAEAVLLKKHGLKQPGHTRWQYSTRNEDLSDAAQSRVGDFPQKLVS